MTMLERHKAMIAGGWSFEWEPETFYICAKHPRGGIQSVLEIRNPEFRYLGPVIADMMNGKDPTHEQA